MTISRTQVGCALDARQMKMEYAAAASQASGSVMSARSDPDGALFPSADVVLNDANLLLHRVGLGAKEIPSFDDLRRFAPYFCLTVWEALGPHPDDIASPLAPGGRGASGDGPVNARDVWLVIDALEVGRRSKYKKDVTRAFSSSKSTLEPRRWRASR